MRSSSRKAAGLALALLAAVVLWRPAEAVFQKFLGPINTTSITNAGALTNTGALTVAGAATFNGAVSVSSAAAFTKPVTFSSSTAFWAMEYAVVQDTKPAGTNGGTFTAGAWQQRTLTYVATATISGFALSQSTMVLPAGLYYVRASAPAKLVDTHRARLTRWGLASGADAVVLSTGTNAYNNSGGNDESYSVVEGFFSCASQCRVILEHRSQSSQATTGFGGAGAAGLGEEVYSTVYLWKLR